MPGSRWGHRAGMCRQRRTGAWSLWETVTFLQNSKSTLGISVPLFVECLQGALALYGRIADPCFQGKNWGFVAREKEGSMMCHHFSLCLS